MQIDDDAPRPQRAVTVGEDLTLWSIEDLQERIETLRGEITRTERELGSKRAGRAAAEAVFGNG